jgi:aminopeptidase YwaD
MQYQMRTTEKDKNFMVGFIKDICETIGPRRPCSVEERQCAQFLVKHLEKYCDEAWSEDFFCRPGAYRVMFHWPILFYIFALPFLFFYPLVSLLIATFVIIMLVGNEIYNVELIDLLFKKQKSTNVIAKIRPSKEIKNIIILSGHHDSNWEFPFGKRFGTKVSIFMVLPLIFNPLLALFSILKMTIPIPLITNIILFVIMVAPIPILIPFGIKVISKTSVMGANDNLSALAVCLSAAHYFSDSNNKLMHSEVWIVSFGCEEIGIRGSKRFVTKHLEEIKKAYSINLDLVGEKNCHMNIVTKEEMGAIKLSKEIGDILQNASRKANVPVTRGPVMCFTDSMAFSMKKVKSAALVGLLPNQNMPRFYHTLNDTPENIDPAVMGECLELCLQAMYDIDAKFS